MISYFYIFSNSLPTNESAISCCMVYLLTTLCNSMYEEILTFMTLACLSQVSLETEALLDLREWKGLKGTLADQDHQDCRCVVWQIHEGFKESQKHCNRHSLKTQIFLFLFLSRCENDLGSAAHRSFACIFNRTMFSQSPKIRYIVLNVICGFQYLRLARQCYTLCVWNIWNTVTAGCEMHWKNHSCKHDIASPCFWEFYICAWTVKKFICGCSHCLNSVRWSVCLRLTSWSMPLLCLSQQQRKDTTNRENERDQRAKQLSWECMGKLQLKGCTTPSTILLWTM